MASKKWFQVLSRVILWSKGKPLSADQQRNSFAGFYFGRAVQRRQAGKDTCEALRTRVHDVWKDIILSTHCIGLLLLLLEPQD